MWRGSPGQGTGVFRSSGGWVVTEMSPNDCRCGGGHQVRVLGVVVRVPGCLGVVVVYRVPRAVISATHLSPGGTSRLWSMALYP